MNDHICQLMVNHLNLNNYKDFAFLLIKSIKNGSITDVLFKVHVAPAGTVKFATALLLIVLEQFAANPSGATPKPHAIMMSFKKRFFIDITLLYYEFKI